MRPSTDSMADRNEAPALPNVRNSVLPSPLTSAMYDVHPLTVQSGFQLHGIAALRIESEPPANTLAAQLPSFRGRRMVTCPLPPKSPSEIPAVRFVAASLDPLT